jgi:hypothetical protein
MNSPEKIDGTTGTRVIHVTASSCNITPGWNSAATKMRGSYNTGTRFVVILPIQSLDALPLSREGSRTETEMAAAVDVA